MNSCLRMAAAQGLGTTTVPVIDLDGPAGLCVEQIAYACADWGFFQVANHGIGRPLATALQDASRAFFGQPLPAKQAVSRTLENPFGYYDRELTKNLRDRKEIFDYAPREATPWPPHPRGFREALQDYAGACHRVALHLLELCCRGLGAEPASLECHFGRGHSSFLRLNHYPVDDHLAGTDAPVPGPFGISQHSDAGALTLLLQDEVTGLQVLRHERWCDVVPVPGTLTINIGDMLQVWSNDRYRAPLHRVRASGDRARFSAAYFLNPDYNTVVAPLATTVAAAAPARFRPVHWGEFRHQRALGDYGDYGEEIQVSHFRNE